MLNGIGGNTIEQAERNLSHAELAIWRAYRAKRGSLNIGRRVEQAIGNWQALYSTFKGVKNVDARDYMPHEDVEVMDYEALRREQYEKQKRQG